MLKDELTGIQLLFREVQSDAEDRCFSSRLQKMVEKIAYAWTQAAFSASPDHSLKRYFQFHLDGIRQLSDTIFSCRISACQNTRGQLDEIDAALISLIRLIVDNFNSYFDRNATAPQSYHLDLFEAMQDGNLSLRRDLACSPIDASLKKCVLDYLVQMVGPAPATRYTFGSLFYYQNFVLKLSEMKSSVFIKGLNEKLAEKLISLNFNRLDFMLYQTNVLTQKSGNDLTVLKLTRRSYQWRMVSQDACEPSWPSITEMLAGWLDEELNAVKLDVFPAEKLSLNLSVAHLACLTRLFFEENIYNSQALTAIFKFIAGHFETKRQSHISTGGFSKEYYSVSQVTAAVIRDKLLRMVSRINREYFPAVVATGGAALLYSALR